eukprot:315781_1
MRQKIEIENIRRFLNSINLKETKLNDSSRAELIQKAKRFNIKPHHTNKIFNKLKAENNDKLIDHNDKEESSDEETKEFTETTDDMSRSPSPSVPPQLNRSASVDQMNRAQWIIGSKCQVFSNTAKKWYMGGIVNITKDDEGEWLTVRYSVNHIRKNKQIQ